MATFIHREMQKCVQHGFRILLLEAYTVRVFGDKMNLSYIAAVPQEHGQTCLIVNLAEKPNEGTPSINNTTDSDVAP